MGLEKIKHLSKVKNISVDELVEKSGVPKSTVNKIINGFTENPGYKTILALSHALSLTVDEFIDLLDLDLSETRLSAYEERLVSDYRNLSSASQKLIQSTLKNLKKVEDTAQNTASPRNVCDISNKMKVIYLEQAAGMGFGQENDNLSTTTMEFNTKDVPCGASFAVPVVGDSMDPTFRDGDTLFIQMTADVGFGEIVMVALNGENLIKELSEEGLVSHNKKYETIKVNGSDSIRIVGRVLSKANI
jgi:Predicted transcriptional regulator